MNKQQLLNDMWRNMLNSGTNQETQHWYDYENQKALRLPPVGEACQIRRAGEDWFESKLLFAGEKMIVVKVYSEEVGLRPYHVEFRPLDWKKSRVAAVNELTDLIKAEGVEGITAVSCADSILAAGYRKCDN